MGFLGSKVTEAKLQESDPRVLLLEATALQLKGNVADAEVLASLALDRFGAGETNERIDAMTFLGKVCQLQGRFDEARSHFDAALVAQRELLGSDHPEVYEQLARVAYVDEMRGDVASAIDLYTVALDGLETHKGWADGSTNHCVANLARTLAGAGSRDALAKAVTLHLRADDGLSHALGEDDPRAVANRLSLASSYARSGRTEDARAILVAAMDVLDPRHPTYRVAMMAEMELEDAD